MQHKQTAIHCSWMKFVLGVMQRKGLRTFPVLAQALVGDSAGLQNNGVIIEAVEGPLSTNETNDPFQCCVSYIKVKTPFYNNGIHSHL